MDLLLIDDDKEVGELLTTYLKKNGFNVTYCSNSKRALEWIEKKQFDIVVTDIRMPDIDGIDILKRVKKDSFETEVIVITGYGTTRNAISALKEGASDFILKPADLEDILFSVQKVAKFSKLRRENILFKEQIEHKKRELSSGRAFRSGKC